MCLIENPVGGAAFFAGKGISNKGEKASILGSIAAAYHVRAMAKHYEVPVILHTDHCAKKLLPWLDGVLDADEKHFKEHGTFVAFHGQNFRLSFYHIVK